VNAPPPNAIDSVLAEGGPPDDKHVLVVVGDSITQGTIGHRWAEDVAAALGDDWFVVNAGTNGEVAYEVAERLLQVAACDPDVVTVLIGTNDVMLDYAVDFGEQAVADRNLPERSNVSFYREQLTRISTTLSSTTSAQVALLSVPTVGENPEEDVWALTASYAAVAEEVAADTGVVYGPLHEDMVAALEALPRRETPSMDNWLSLVTDGVFKHATGQSWDAIGEDLGFYMHSDHLHLDEDGAALITSIVLDVVNDAETD